MKLFFQLFLIQLLLYAILVINFHAVAQANIIVSVVSDTIIASMNFFVIKKIASSENSFVMFIGYTAGSAFGSVVGILLSKALMGQ